MAAPIADEEIMWSKVAPIKRKLPVTSAPIVSPPAIGAKIKSEFSIAEKPRAMVII